MKKTINEITTVFLEYFNDNWLATLKTFQTDQAQLVIGNRLRPQICLWGYLSSTLPCEVEKKELQNLSFVAVSIELIHKASLLLDDWIDCDQERHGKPAFHIEHSPQEAVLLALNMIGLAMIRLKENIINPNIILPHHYFLCFNALLDTIYNMAQGALKELRLEEKNLFDKNLIYEISKLETSKIISNSLLIGYYVGLRDNMPDSMIETKFDQIGEKCEYLFQAMNDLEFFANPEKLKKHKGNLNTDILNKRKNLAITTLYDVAANSDKNKLKKDPEKYILPLMEKYHIRGLFDNQLKALFKELHKQVIQLDKLGISNEWIQGFLDFLSYIKKFGENRLKK